MNKVIRLTAIRGGAPGQIDIRAEFLIDDEVSESMSLNKYERDAIAYFVNIDHLLKGESFLISTETIRQEIDTGKVEFYTDDDDWTEFESRLRDFLTESNCN